LSPNEALSQIYFEALRVLEGRRLEALANSFSVEQLKWLANFSDSPEKHKGGLAVLITCLLKKVISPEQDIRMHQAIMPGGFGGRILDAKFVTPFLREQGFPSMRETGWSIRSLEQPFPYNKNYPGKITPPVLKVSFLSLLDDVQVNPSLARDFLVFVLAKLEQYRRSQGGDGFVRLPSDFVYRLSLSTIAEMLETHFNAKYRSINGAARLPVLAMYSLYQCLVPELARYKGKGLLPLKSPTGADLKANTVGTIRVVNVTNGQLWEGIEIKYGEAIGLGLVQTAVQKIKMSNVERYYLLSTADVKADERKRLAKYAAMFKNEYECELIMDGLLPVLRYYLPAITNPAEFLDNYGVNLKQDRFVKTEHRLAWISILQGYSLPGD
jgi:DNA (cytosine-5)-methyltransferase 1